jgi:sugar phosphate isomerase/epimerase
MSNNYPKLHNAMWPGLVGKGSPGAEPCIDLDTMLDLTAQAEVNGVKFDGVDLFLFEPHVGIDISDDGLRALADKIAARGFVVGSVVAPVWPPTGGGSAMGSEQDRKQFVEQVRKACRIASKLRELGLRNYGVVRIDSASSVADWDKDPVGSTRLIAQTFREAADVAESYGERLAAEGEICWGGMHSWRAMVDLLEQVDRPETVGFQADMAHTLLYTLGYNAGPEDRIVPENFNWEPPALAAALRQLTAALRPWTIDFHVAQNDGTVFGSGTHDNTGRHCQVNDPNGKLNPARDAGYWLRDESGEPTRAFRHICWDGCMFPNAVMMEAQTWNNILGAMIAVRTAHGWSENGAATVPPQHRAASVVSSKAPRATARKAAAPAKAKAKAKAKTNAKTNGKGKGKPKAMAKAKARVKVKSKAKTKAKATAKKSGGKARSKAKAKVRIKVKASRKPAKKKTSKGKK